uniref:Uncharacterized protein LOC102802581 n=1 Tax=Saccoglossus kowalevskii TaxID=10224 RepID=A0ABM0M159_SACKO|nr:PREDICTED: uncharacterized protein LOC102802581 [Saccoglossus kowalevskii]
MMNDKPSTFDSIMTPLDLSTKKVTQKELTNISETTRDDKYYVGSRMTFANPWSKDLAVWNAKNMQHAVNYQSPLKVNAVSREHTAIAPTSNAAVANNGVNVKEPGNASESKGGIETVQRREEDIGKCSLSSQVPPSPLNQTIRNAITEEENDMSAEATEIRSRSEIDTTSPHWRQFKFSANHSEVSKKRKRKAKTWQVPVGHGTVALLARDILTNDQHHHLSGAAEWPVDNLRSRGVHGYSYLTEQEESVVYNPKKILLKRNSLEEECSSNNKRVQLSPAAVANDISEQKHEDVLRALLRESNNRAYNTDNLRSMPTVVSHVGQNGINKLQSPEAQLHGTTNTRTNVAPVTTVPNAPTEIRPKKDELLKRKPVVTGPFSREEIQSTPVIYAPTNSTPRLTPTPLPRTSYQITTIAPDEINNYKGILQREEATLIPVYLDEKQEKTSMLISRDGSCTELRAVVIGRAPSTEADIKVVPRAAIVDTIGTRVPVHQSCTSVTRSGQANVQSPITLSLCGNNTITSGKRPTMSEPIPQNMYNESDRGKVPREHDKHSRKLHDRHLGAYQESYSACGMQALGRIHHNTDTQHQNAVQVNIETSSPSQTIFSDNKLDLNDIHNKHHSLSYCRDVRQTGMSKLTRVDNAQSSDISRNILEQLNQLSVSKLLEIQKSWTDKPNSDNMKKSNDPREQSGERWKKCKDSCRPPRSNPIFNTAALPVSTPTFMKPYVSSPINDEYSEKSLSIKLPEQYCVEKEADLSANRDKKSINPALRDALDARVSSVISANDSLLQAHEIPRKRPWSKKDWEERRSFLGKRARRRRSSETSQLSSPGIFSGPSDNAVAFPSTTDVNGITYDGYTTNTCDVPVCQVAKPAESNTASPSQTPLSSPVTMETTPTQTRNHTPSYENNRVPCVQPPKKNLLWRHNSYTHSTDSEKQKPKTESEATSVAESSDSSNESQDVAPSLPTDDSRSLSPLTNESRNVPTETNQTFTSWLKFQLQTNTNSNKNEKENPAENEQTKENTEMSETSSTGDSSPVGGANMAGMIQTMIEVIMETHQQSKKLVNNIFHSDNNNNNDGIVTKTKGTTCHDGVSYSRTNDSPVRLALEANNDHISR